MFCRCGCGETIAAFDKRNRPRQYKYHHHRSGKNSNFWNGGRIITVQGYVKIRKRDHPFADAIGYVFEHRLVMERHLGRYLNDTEHVHHINHNIIDNRIETQQKS